MKAPSVSPFERRLDRWLQASSDVPLVTDAPAQLARLQRTLAQPLAPIRTADALLERGALLARLGLYDEAQLDLAACLQQLATHAPDSVLHAIALERMTRVQLARGRFQDAQECSHWALSLLHETLGEHHPDVLAIRSLHALTLLHTFESWNDGIEQARRAHEALARGLSRHHPGWLLSSLAHAIGSAHQGDTAHALTLIRDGLGAEAVDTAHDPWLTLLALRWLCVLSEWKGPAASASRSAAALRAFVRRARQPSHPEQTWSLIAFAQRERADGDLQLALSLASSAHQLLEASETVSIDTRVFVGCAWAQCALQSRSLDDAGSAVESLESALQSAGVSTKSVDHARVTILRGRVEQLLYGETETSALSLAMETLENHWGVEHAETRAYRALLPESMRDGPSSRAEATQILMRSLELATQHITRAEYPDARKALGTLVEAARGPRLREVELAAQILLVRACAGERDLDAAKQHARRAHQLAREAGDADSLQTLQSMMDALDLHDPQTEITAEAVFRAKIDAAFAQVRIDPRGGLEALERCAKQAEADGVFASAAAARVLRGRILLEAGDKSGAREDLTLALELSVRAQRDQFAAQIRALIRQT